jgi:prevent-host-death family protein
MATNSTTAEAGDIITIVTDYGNNMKKPWQIAAGEFKAKCLALMSEVQQSGTPLIVTKHGKPLVKVIPYEDEDRPFPLGYMKGRIHIKGDIFSTGEQWNADKDQ